MSWQNNLAKIGYRDRKEPCKIFRAILRQEISYRGIVLHSNGQKGVGKSTLLDMFEDVWRTTDLPFPTELLYFTPDSLSMIDWQAILDSTVEHLGRNYFTHYTQLRSATKDKIRRYDVSTGSSGQTVYIHETYIHNVQGPVHTGSGDLREGNTESNGQAITEVYHRGPERDSFISQEELRQQLTIVFLEDLSHIPHIGQMVWLVDSAEKLDEATKEWLIRLLGGIAQQKIKHLILVVAGRDRLRYEPRWIYHIVELEVSYFTIETIVEIIRELWPNDDVKHCVLTAEMLLKVTKGDPLSTIAWIEQLYNRSVFI